MKKDDNQLLTLRHEIDKIGNEISKLFLERMNISYKIGLIKKHKNIEDLTRETEVFNNIKKNASSDLEKNQLDALYKTIIKLSKNNQIEK